MGCYGGFVTEEREGDSRTDEKHRDHTRARVCSEALVLSTYKIALLLRLFEFDALGNGEPKCVATVYHRPALLQNEAINHFI